MLAEAWIEKEYWTQYLIRGLGLKIGRYPGQEMGKKSMSKNARKARARREERNISKYRSVFVCCGRMLCEENFKERFEEVGWVFGGERRGRRRREEKGDKRRMDG